MDSKTAQLEGELKTGEEQHLKEVDDLTAKVREQEARAQGETSLCTHAGSSYVAHNIPGSPVKLITRVT